MYNSFVDNNFRTILKKVVNREFEKLLADEQSFLLNHLEDIINVISNRFCFDMYKKNSYIHQFTQNDYRDIIAILYIILPFIKGDTKKITALSEIYNKKVVDVNINNEEPNYIYSNFQYGRCIRDDGNKRIMEKPFSRSFIDQNVILLKQTIDIISNKLYVNWLDVRPFTLTNYKESLLYQETKKHFDNFNLVEWDYGTTNKDYKGLYIGDFYNVLVNDLFHNMEDIKWVLYDSFPIIYNQLNYLIPFIVVLGEVVPLNQLANKISWKQLDYDEKLSFYTGWTNLVGLAKQNQSYGKYTGRQYNKIIGAILEFFQDNYSNITKAKQDGYISFISLKSTKLTEEEKEEGTYFDVHDPQSQDSLNTLSVEHLYSYLLEVFYQFHRTWYATRILLKDDVTGLYKVKNTKEIIENGLTIGAKLDISKMTEEEIEGIRKQNIEITMKNLFNFGKAISYNYYFTDKDKKPEQYPNFWRSLPKEYKHLVLNRINNYGNIYTIGDSLGRYYKDNFKNISEWFNIRGYIRRIYDFDDDELNFYNTIAFIKIRYRLLDIIFEILIQKGVLSTFTPHKDITDETLLPYNENARAKKQQELLEKIVLNDKEIEDKWSSAYYYITGEPYVKMSCDRPAPNDKSGKRVNYLEYIRESSEGMWINTYAVNWVSQISFFHKYIHTRVFYVTGATGAGKSTQAPKLLLYALSMIEYKPAGKIICTQPRVSPTTNVSDWVSQQLGVPMYYYNKHYKKKIPSLNYYVQYKHQKEDHMRTQYHPLLRFVTDGTLYQELKQYPLLKKGKNINNSYEFTTENVYDIIIIDEAHEHNKNMDLILTMMRYVTYYNNSVKLVIISATMDADEPIYRRYYRNVNDNLTYPLNMLLKEKRIDRINIDRRLHVSPPGQTTRFTIRDFYLPDADPVEVVMNIIRNKGSGDILLFQPGQKEINQAIEKLNVILPPNCIAIPYYGQMDSEKRKFVESIEKNKTKLNIPRSIPFDSPYNEYEIETVPYGTYNRVVVVATNIAEASITIGSLRDVIDTGTQKTMRYDYRINFPKLDITYISESSRMQRRGRVGRVAPGDVTYLYPQKFMENNKIQFDISISDISENLFDLLREELDDNPDFKVSLDPNIPNKNSKLLEISKENINEKLFPRGIHKMIRKQYYIFNDHFGYRGLNDQYDYDNYTAPPVYYPSGYDIKTLNDSQGIFYIIHPEELNLIRNIGGHIIKVKNEYDVPISRCVENDIYSNCRIQSKKIEKMWNVLEDYLIIISNSTNDYYQPDTLIRKTEFGVYCNNIKQRLELEKLSYLLTYLYSRTLNVNTSINYIVPLIATIPKIMSIAHGSIVNGRYKTDIESIKELYNNPYGDLIGLRNIATTILSFINQHYFNIDITATLDKITRENILDQKKLYLKHRLDGKFNGIDEWLVKIFIKMDGNNKLDNTFDISDEEEKEYIKNNVNVSRLSTLITNDYDQFAEWCRINYFNSNIVLKYIVNYMYYINNIIKYDNELYNVDLDIKERDIKLNKLTERITPLDVSNDNINNNIIRSFAYGFSHNVVRKIDGSNVYIDINAVSPKYTYEIGTVNPKVPIKTTLFLDHDIYDYLLFIERDDTSIHIINSIEPKLLQKQTISYRPSKFYLEQYNINNQYDEITRTLSVSLQKGNHNIISSNYIRTIKNIKKDFINHFDERIWEIVMQLNTDKPYKSLIALKRRKQAQITEFIKGQSGGYYLKTDNSNKNHDIISPYIDYLKKLINVIQIE